MAIGPTAGRRYTGYMQYQHPARTLLGVTSKVVGIAIVIGGNVTGILILLGGIARAESVAAARGALGLIGSGAGVLLIIMSFLVGFLLIETGEWIAPHGDDGERPRATIITAQDDEELRWVA